MRWANRSGVETRSTLKGGRDCRRQSCDNMGEDRGGAGGVEGGNQPTEREEVAKVRVATPPISRRAAAATNPPGSKCARSRQKNAFKKALAVETTLQSRSQQKGLVSPPWKPTCSPPF